MIYDAEKLKHYEEQQAMLKRVREARLNWSLPLRGISPEIKAILDRYETCQHGYRIHASNKYKCPHCSNSRFLGNLLQLDVNERKRV